VEQLQSRCGCSHRLLERSLRNHRVTLVRTNENWTFNTNFFKNFKLTERFRLKLRAKLYDTFNHHNRYIQTLNLEAS
jgi:hypothetical protein